MYSFNVFSILSLFASQVYLMLGVYILSKNTKASANRLFFLVASTMSLWGFGEGMQRASMDAGTAFFWSNYVSSIGSMLHGPLLLHFWLDFSGSLTRVRKRIPLFVIYIPALAMLLLRLLYPSLLVEGQTLEYWGYSTLGTPLYQLYMLFVVIYVSSVVVLAFRKAMQSRGRIRRQSMNIGLGILFSLSIGIITQAMRPLLNLSIPELSVISTFIFISFFAHAVSRHGLLTITTKTVAENIIATMNDYVVAVDRRKKIALVNNSLLKTLGYTRNELVGKPLKSIFSDDSVPKGLPIADYQAKIISKEGEKIPVSANVSELREESNRALGTVFVMRDVREINRLVSSLEQKKKELESKNYELERFNKMAVGRELKMIELKKTIKELEKKVR